MPLVVIDGYNMIRRLPRLQTAERLGLAGGREALLRELEDYGAATGAQMVVIFDGSGRPGLQSGDLPAKDSFAGIDVMFSAKGISADQLIMEIVEELRTNGRCDGLIEDCRDAIVVTDDYALRDDAISLGAYVISVYGFDVALKSKSHLFY